MNKKIFIAVIMLSMIVMSAQAAFILNEGFESPTFPPTGWTNYDIDANSPWQRTTIAARVLNGVGAADINKNQLGNNDDWLITNRLGLITVNDSIFFSFRSHDQSSPESIHIMISTDPDSSNLSLYTQLQVLDLSGTTNPPYGTAKVSLASYDGQNIFVAFRYVTTTQGDGVSIDDISVGTQDPTYTVIFDEIGLPNGTYWDINFNSNNYSSTTDTIIIPNVLAGSYNWTALTPISGGPGVQYVGTPANGTMNVPTQLYQTIIYTTQYYLTVISPYSTTSGEGWYNSGETAYAGVTDSIVYGAPGVRYVFIGWSVDATGSYLTSDQIEMNAPKTATANWKTQYYLTLATNPTGLLMPSGEGWYDADSFATIIAVNPDSTSLPPYTYFFTDWSTADMSEITDPYAVTTTVYMDMPKTVTANYQAMMRCTNGKTIGYWTNKNGQGLLVLSDATYLNTLAPYATYTSYPKEPAGTTPFNTTNLSAFKRQVKDFLNNANAIDMRYMLAAQLLATELDVLHGFVNPTHYVWVDDGDMVFEAGEDVLISTIINNAITEWSTGSRTTQTYWKNLLDAINNNWLWCVVSPAVKTTQTNTQVNTNLMANDVATTNSLINVIPNPIVNNAVVRYTVPVNGKVTVKLYNSLGNVVETIADGYLNQGTYTNTITTAKLAKGVYFLKYEDVTNTKNIKLTIR